MVQKRLLHLLFIVVGFVLFVTQSTTKVDAYCLPQDSQGCIGSNPYTCTNDGLDFYCCSVSASECNAAVGDTPSTSPASAYFGNWLIGMGLNSNFWTIPGIINTLVPIIITVAGLILFLMLIAGGFQMLTSAGNPETAKMGQGRITTALIGFLIIFAAYWIVQIMEIVLGVNILGN